MISVTPTQLCPCSPGAGLCFNKTSFTKAGGRKDLVCGLSLASPCFRVSRSHLLPLLGGVLPVLIFTVCLRLLVCWLTTPVVTWTVASFQRTPVVYCVRLARALVDDYCCLVPGSVQTLKQIFSASPRFCCQFITSVTALYDLSSGKLYEQAVALRTASADGQRCIR